MSKRKKLTKEKKLINQKIKIRVKSPTTHRRSWQTFNVISIDDEGWMKVEGSTKPYFYIHKDILKNHIKEK